MKKISLLFLALLLGTFLNSCKHENDHSNLIVYETTWDKIVNEGQIDLINPDYFDPNITMVYSPENIVGIDAFKAYYQNFITGFSEVKFTIIDALQDGDKIAKHWRFQGKHTGDFFGIPATGKTVDIEGATIALMLNGKIMQEQDFMDNSVFLQQLGLAPNPENSAIIDQLYTYFSKGEVPAVLEMMSPNIVWNESSCSTYADDNPYTSPEAILNGIFGRIGQDNEYFKIENIQLAGLGGNKVLASLNYDFKSKKTGEVHKTSVVHEWTLENGKITGFQQYLGLGKQ